MALAVSFLGALLFSFQATAIQLTPGVFGHTAPLTEAGYLAVAALKSNDDMKAYIHRICEREARYVKDVGELNGVLPYYSGEKVVQSLDALRSELRRASWVANGEGRTAALNEVGYQQVAKLNSSPHMTAFARRILDQMHMSVADEGALTGLMAYHSGKTAVQNFDKLKQDLLDPSFAKNLKPKDPLASPSAVIDGHTAPLNEEGYLAVASLKSDNDMKAYIYRICEREARYVKDAAELNGVVPYYSGVIAVQSLDALRNELRRASWVANGEGRTVALNEVGYQQVAKLNSSPHMTAFARRILDELHVRVADEGALAGLLAYHSGKIAAQSFDKLKQDLLDASFAQNLKSKDAVESPDEDAIGSATAESTNTEDTTVAEAQKKEIEPEDVMAAFKAFDIDGSNFLSTAELKQAVKSLNKEFSEEAVAEMLIEVDADGSGEIDADEFMTKMRD